jgi:TrmH family RNA methyltransferase
LQNYEFICIFASELTTFLKMISKNQLKYIRQLEQKKYRRREGVFVAEGTKVVGDLLQRYRPEAVFATADWQAPAGITPQLVTDDELRRISFLQHPQQVLALFPLPVNSKPSTPNSELSLALDGVQDPGNLGTIIRIADWFGITTIYCSEDTADCYNPKVVQATMGSLAHINIVYTDLEALLRQYDGPIYGTLLDGQNIYQQELSSEGIIVMGNEGNGISPAIRQLVTHKLLIPNYNPSSETAESLNVAIATAITCAEFRRVTVTSNIL